MAINFPSTAGQNTDGTFTYVVAGITYSWNGESWTAAGSGASDGTLSDLLQRASLLLDALRLSSRNQQTVNILRQNTATSLQQAKLSTQQVAHGGSDAGIDANADGADADADGADADASEAAAAFAAFSTC